MTNSQVYRVPIPLFCILNYVAGPNKYDVFDRTPGCAENPTYRDAPQAQQPVRRGRTVVAVASMMLLGSVRH